MKLWHVANDVPIGVQELSSPETLCLELNTAEPLPFGLVSLWNPHDRVSDEPPLVNDASISVLGEEHNHCVEGAFVNLTNQIDEPFPNRQVANELLPNSQVSNE